MSGTLEDLKNDEIESVLEGRFAEIDFNFGRKGCHKMMWVPFLILTSFAMNMTAIFLPFMTVHPFHQDAGTFNIISLIK